MRTLIKTYVHFIDYLPFYFIGFVVVMALIGGIQIFLESGFLAVMDPIIFGIILVGGFGFLLWLADKGKQYLDKK